MIRDFDAKSIENECFGGASSVGGGWGWGKGFGGDNSKNAYILVYERTLKEDIQLVFNTEEDFNKYNSILKFS